MNKMDCGGQISFRIWFRQEKTYQDNARPSSEFEGLVQCNGVKLLVISNSDDLCGDIFRRCTLLVRLLLSIVIHNLSIGIMVKVLLNAVDRASDGKIEILGFLDQLVNTIM
jgi:hypothetical protein